MNQQAPPGYTEHDVFAGSVTLPAFFEDVTWYEFKHPNHPLRSILIDSTTMAADLARARLIDRRNRVLGTGVAVATEPEPFSNPHLSAEGFAFHPIADQQGDERSYFVVVARKPTFLTLTVRCESAMVGLVHALVERLTEALSQPSAEEGWHWRRIGGLWVPIPDGATDPTQFDFDFAGGIAHVTVRPCDSAQLPLLMSTEVTLMKTPVEHSHSPLGYPVTGLSAEGVDTVGEARWFAAAAVSEPAHGLLLQARAEGDHCAAVSAEWPMIVARTRL